MMLYSRKQAITALGCSFKTLYRLSVRALHRTSGPYTPEDIERMRAYQIVHGVQSETTKAQRRATMLKAHQNR